MSHPTRQEATPSPPHTHSFFYISKDSECQPVCRPTSKTLKVKGGYANVYVPGGLHNLLYTWILVLSRLMPNNTIKHYKHYLTKPYITYIMYSYE